MVSVSEVPGIFKQRTVAVSVILVVISKKHTPIEQNRGQPQGSEEVLAFSSWNRTRSAKDFCGWLPSSVLRAPIVLLSTLIAELVDSLSVLFLAQACFLFTTSDPTRGAVVPVFRNLFQWMRQFSLSSTKSFMWFLVTSTASCNSGIPCS